MIRKIQNGAAVFLVFLVSFLPLAVKVLQDALHIPVVGSDSALFNFVFAFVCVAGAVTWREGRHISLASVFDGANPKIRSIVERSRCVPTVAILTVLAFASLSQAASQAVFFADQKVWGIPVFLFQFLAPVMYFSMIFCEFMRNRKLEFALGLAFGIVASANPISGVLYFSMGIDDSAAPVLYKTASFWTSLPFGATCALVLFLAACAFLGVPLFVCISAITCVLYPSIAAIEAIPLKMYETFMDKSVAAIPLFTIAGYILSQGSAGARLLEVFKSVYGCFRGGSVVAAVLVSTFFTTFTGVSSVTILAMGSILTLMLCGTGFDKKDAQSLVTVSGATGLMFPPSVAIIMFGTTNIFYLVNPRTLEGYSIVDLFKAAVIPGFLMLAARIAIGFSCDRAKNRPKFSAKALLSAAKNAAPELAMPVLVAMCFFSGKFSLLEIASIAAVYSFVLETFLRRDFSLKGALKIVSESVPVTGGVLIILGAASGLAAFLNDAGIPSAAATFVSSHVHSKFAFLFALNICLLIVGCLMDIYSAILIVSPIAMSCAASFGINPLQTAIVFLVNLQIGFITPPVGMDLFIASYAFGTPVLKVAKGILPYLALETAILFLITYCPFFTMALL